MFYVNLRQPGRRERGGASSVFLKDSAGPSEPQQPVYGEQIENADGVIIV